MPFAPKSATPSGLMPREDDAGPFALTLAANVLRGNALGGFDLAKREKAPRIQRRLHANSICMASEGAEWVICPTEM